jgi:hypothetical protein
MPATMKTEVVGVKETIKALREIDPQFRKDFNKGARAVVAPMVAEAKARYPSLPLSGMARAWTPRQFSIFPWQQSKVRSSVKVKTSTRRNANSVVYVSQGVPSAVLFETISNSNRLGSNIRARSNRVLWPAADRHLPAIQLGVALLVKERPNARCRGWWTANGNHYSNPHGLQQPGDRPRHQAIPEA